MFNLEAVKDSKLHPDVASFLASAQKDIMQTLDKHKATHLAMRAQMEKRALSGDAEALKQYRHLVRVETIWKTLSARMSRDLQSLTDAAKAAPREPKSNAFAPKKTK